jgi:hypothetical protein
MAVGRQRDRTASTLLMLTFRSRLRRSSDREERDRGAKRPDAKTATGAVTATTARALPN